MDGDLPCFVRVGDRVGAAFGEVTVFAEKIDGNINGFAGAAGSFSHQTANAVADASVFGRHDVVLIDAGAGVGYDRDAFFIDEAVREGGAFGRIGLRPEEAVGLFHLRNFGGGFFELDHLAGLMGLGGNPVLGGQDTAAVVFVVADQDMTVFTDVLADDNG